MRVVGTDQNDRDMWGFYEFNYIKLEYLYVVCKQEIEKIVLVKHKNIQT